MTGAPLSAAVVGVSPLWYATRATGVVALVLLTATVILGVAGSTRLTVPGLPRVIVAGLHRNVSLLVLALVGAHVLTTVLDSYTRIGLSAVVVPFSSDYRGFWLGLGAVAFDLLLAVALTSMLRDRLPYQAWRAVHWLAYACWPIALWHGLGTGTDTRLPWMLALDAVCVAGVTGAVCWRLAPVTPCPARTAAIAVTVLLPLATAAFILVGPLQHGWARRAGTPPALLGLAPAGAPVRTSPPPGIRPDAAEAGPPGWLIAGAAVIR
ncbi:MAG: ferric reductase-like transmembrane domain-containing protein [Streptosporangiaceae bacterium]